MSVDTNALRRGFGSAAGLRRQIGAYHKACNKAADEIDRLRLEAQMAQRPAYWAYVVNGVHQCFTVTEPPDDAYDEGSLRPLYTKPQPDCVAGLLHRIAELEDAAYHARETLDNSTLPDRAEWIKKRDESINKLDEVLK
jgi:hypothetical protein